MKKKYPLKNWLLLPVDEKNHPQPHIVKLAVTRISTTLVVQCELAEFIV